MRNPPNYQGLAAKVVIQRIVDRPELGPADTPELIAVSGLSPGRARDHIRHVAGTGRIYCVARPVMIAGGGNTPAVWALDPGYIEPVVDENGDDFPRRVMVRQQWEPNHVRMPMECLLFGVPAALQGAAAC